MDAANLQAADLQQLIDWALSALQTNRVLVTPRFLDKLNVLLPAIHLLFEDPDDQVYFDTAAKIMVLEGKLNAGVDATATQILTSAKGHPIILGLLAKLFSGHAETKPDAAVLLAYGGQGNPDEFAAALKAAIEQNPEASRHGQRVLDILNEPPSPHRDRMIRRMERHAAARIEQPFGAIDWKQVLAVVSVLLTVVQFLAFIVPFLA